MTTRGEIPGGHVLPRGRLREPRDLVARADVLVVVGADAAEARDEADRIGVAMACGASRTLGQPILLATESSVLRAPDSVLRAPCFAPVVAACGIANPRRFVDDLTAAGWNVARAETFADHHRFTRADLGRVARAVTACGAVAGLTTDKDAVRFEPLAPWPFPLYRVPIAIGFDPPDTLFARVAATIAAHRRGAARAGVRRVPGRRSARVRQALEYGAVVAVEALACRLPAPLVRAWGDALGLAAYVADARHRRVALANLAACFPGRSEAERRAIARRTFRHFGRLLLALLRFSRLDPARRDALVEIDGADHVRRAYAQGRGVLFFTGHFGFWSCTPCARRRLRADWRAGARARQPAAERPPRGDPRDDGTTASTGRARCGACCGRCTRATGWRC